MHVSTISFIQTLLATGLRGYQGIFHCVVHRQPFAVYWQSHAVNSRVAGLDEDIQVDGAGHSVSSCQGLLSLNVSTESEWSYMCSSWIIKMSCSLLDHLLTLLFYSCKHRLQYLHQAA